MGRRSKAPRPALMRKICTNCRRIFKTPRFRMMCPTCTAEAMGQPVAPPDTSRQVPDGFWKKGYRS